MEQPAYDLTSELSPLDPKRIHLFVDRFQNLVLEMNGEEKRVATVLRSFPLTAMDRFIVLRDEEDGEIGIVSDLSEIDAESRAAIQERLDVHYFTAEIIRINAMWEEFHILTWDVETDRGQRIVEIGSARRDIRTMENGRVLIQDADGNRYEIPNRARLDPASQTILETIV